MVLRCNPHCWVLNARTNFEVSKGGADKRVTESTWHDTWAHSMTLGHQVLARARWLRFHKEG